jgi:hypothetical protein
MFSIHCLVFPLYKKNKEKSTFEIKYKIFTLLLNIQVKILLYFHHSFVNELIDQLNLNYKYLMAIVLIILLISNK